MARSLYAPIEGHCARCKKEVTERVSYAITILQPKTTFLQKFPFYPYHSAIFCPECLQALGLAPIGIFVPMGEEEDIISALKRMITTVKMHVQERAEAKKAADAEHEKNMAFAAETGARSIKEAVDKEIVEQLVEGIKQDEMKECVKDALWVNQCLSQPDSEPMDPYPDIPEVPLDIIVEPKKPDEH